MSTSDRFAGKVAVITGGTTGIGRAIARRFVSDGGKIVIGARHDTLFEEITQELGADNCWCQVCDVTNRAQVDALVQAAYDKFNGFDVMFGNAGINLFKDFLNVTEEEHARIVHNNYFGCFNSTQAAARAFVAHGTKGAIVNTASINVRCQQGRDRHDDAGRCRGACRVRHPCQLLLPRLYRHADGHGSAAHPFPDLHRAEAHDPENGAARRAGEHRVLPRF